MVAAASFAAKIPAGQRGVIKRRGQLQERKWMAVITVVTPMKLRQTHAPLVRCYHHETLSLVMLRDLCVFVYVHVRVGTLKCSGFRWMLLFCGFFVLFPVLLTCAFLFSD